MAENIFEYTTANKLRFPYGGSVSVEELYSLSTAELDTVFKTLNRESKQAAEEESLLAAKAEADEALLIKIDVVKYIVSKKMQQAQKNRGLSGFLAKIAAKIRKIFQSKSFMEDTVMNENIFEYAVANKLRFPYKGSISTEDLYDLSVNQLDEIFKALNKESKKAEEESLLATKSEADVALLVKIDIVKYIVNKKMAENELRKQAAANREQKDKILAILAERQDEDLRGKSAEELQKMLDELK